MMTKDKRPKTQPGNSQVQDAMRRTYKNGEEAILKERYLRRPRRSGLLVWSSHTTTTLTIRPIPVGLGLLPSPAAS